jgi:nucleotide-binding universal stress UspA family protein
MSHQIVVGVDGSPHSIAALRWALEEAAERSDEVTAVLCWQLPSVPGAFDRDELERGYQELLVSTVSRAAPAAPGAAAHADHASRPGPGPGHRGQGRQAARPGCPQPLAGRRAHARLGQPSLRRRGRLPGRPSERYR